MLKTVTYEDVVSWGPCWLTTDAGRRRLRRYAAKQSEWTALDILRLRRVSADDRLWAVLRPELIDDALLHEYGCRCADLALSRVDHPDPRSIAAIAAKRAWLRGEIDGAALGAARDAVLDAARDAAWEAARGAARGAIRGATLGTELQWQVAELIKMLEEVQDAAD